MPGHETKSAYRQEGPWRVVDLKLKTIAQLYNSFDPSPFHERDLDDAAAQYIEDAVSELHGSGQQVKLAIHVQEALPVEAGNKATEAIHHYFTYRTHVARLRLRQELRLGRLSLAVGLLFLAFCFELSRLTSAQGGTMPSLLREGFLIIGWVAMWRPLEIFLYSWWPLLGKIRLYEKISAMPVEFRRQSEQEKTP